MASRTFILISILFFANSSHSMEIQKQKSQKKHKHNKYPYSTIQELLLTQKICQKNHLPQEIITITQRYSIALKNGDLLNNKEPFIVEWRDFHIPLYFYHLLTPQQILLIKELFTSPISLLYDKHEQCEIHYNLQSNKDYKLFLTLPIEMRRCLTQLPLSGLTQPLRLLRIPVKTIRIKGIPKPILPEDNKEENKKKQWKKIL